MSPYYDESSTVFIVHHTYKMSIHVTLRQRVQEIRPGETSEEGVHVKETRERYTGKTV
jgi:hypothetical protein